MGYNPTLMLFTLLAQAATAPAREDLQKLHYALIMILAIGIVGILLIVALLAAWRNFHKRIGQLEAERDELRQQAPHADAWREAGERVEVEPSTRRPSPLDHDEDDDDSDLYGKDWEPDDDDENPDDEDQPW